MFVWRRGRCFLQQQMTTTLRRHRRIAVSPAAGMPLARCPCVMPMVCCSTLSDGRASSNHNTSSADGNDTPGDMSHEEAPPAEEIPHHSNTTDQSANVEEEVLRTIGRTLCDAAEAEIKAEVERDSRDGTMAIPPLPPLGWKVQHPAGSNYFVMTRTLLGGAKSAELHTRCFQSVHDAFLQAMKEKQWRRGNQRRDTQRSHRTGHSTAGGSNTPDSTSTRMTVGYDTRTKRPAVLRGRTDTADQSHVTRADVHLTLFAPFRVYDPSSYDPTVGICEWSSFDLLVRKTAAIHNGKKGMSSNTRTQNDGSQVAEKPLESMASLVEESGLCLFVHLASVDSEMRIRSVQLLSRHEAQALEEHVCLGKGEPIFLELLRNYRRPSTTTHRLRSIRRYDDPLTRSCGPESPYVNGKRKDSVMTTNDITAAANKGDNNGTSLTAVSYGDAYKLLVDCFDSGGEYSRSLCYNGPYISELSKEMIVALHEYLQGDLGVSYGLCEYVCQMQFFLEQEEYMSWLGRIRHLASVVSQ